MTMNICFKSVILYGNTWNLAKTIANSPSGESSVLDGHCLENETTDPKKAKISGLVYNDIGVWTIAAP